MVSDLSDMDVDVSHAQLAPSQPTTLVYFVPTELPERDHVVLDVDGREHRTRKSVLSSWEYRTSLLSRRWTVDLLPDGSLPIDVDAGRG